MICFYYLYVCGFVEYFIWKDECNEKYIQIISNKAGHDVSLAGKYYLFSIRKYNNIIFLDDVWCLEKNFKAIKINMSFILKAVLKYYNQQMVE